MNCTATTNNTTPQAKVGALVTGGCMLALLGSSVCARVGRKGAAAVLLAAVLATMHLAWGWGSGARVFGGDVDRRRWSDPILK